MIYEELLLPPASNESRPPNTKFVAPIYREDEPNGSTAASHHLKAPRTLQIRTINPTKLSTVLPANSTRPRYHIRDAFRRSTQTTSYALANNPGLHPAILATCKQCHAEASELLYGAYAFDFDTHVSAPPPPPKENKQLKKSLQIEAIIPFLSTLTPLARSFVSRIAIVKRALTLCKEFDRAEWRATFDYLAAELNVPALSLNLGVVAGKPPLGGWDDVPALTVEHFRLVQPRSVRSRPASGATTPTEAADAAGKVFDGQVLHGLGLRAIGGVDFEWVGQLLWLRGLRDIKVNAIIEHCPMPMSETMAFWVSFSKSVEGGFRDWIRGVMLA